MIRGSSFFADAVDQHLYWLAAWHRVAFFTGGPRAAAIDKLQMPKQFIPDDEVDGLPADQPAVEKLSALYDQLHTLSRLILIKAPDGDTVSQDDYEAMLAKNQEFVGALRRMERALATASSTLDPLTGLRNRQGLTEDLMREQKRFIRTGKAYCLALVDIDFFKCVNDTHGHDAGDVVLAAVADHISKTVRVYDDVYRLGGEEFLICFKETDGAMCRAILERMREALVQLPITLPSGESLQVTASFGFAEANRTYSAEESLKRADDALYKAKETGRNKVIAAEDTL